MKEIVKLRRICNRLSSNLKSNAGDSDCVQRGMPSILTTKSGFPMRSLQSDSFQWRFPVNTFYASLEFHKSTWFAHYGTSKLITDVLQLFGLINSDNVNTGRNTITDGLVVGEPKLQQVNIKPLNLLCDLLCLVFKHSGVSSVCVSTWNFMNTIEEGCFWSVT